MKSAPQNNKLPSKCVTFWDKIWKDRQGQVVLFQAPNIWLIIWALATICSLLADGEVGGAAQWMARASLLIWAALEIISGATYFRRGLGAVIFLLTLTAVFKL